MPPNSSIPSFRGFVVALFVFFRVTRWRFRAIGFVPGGQTMEPGSDEYVAILHEEIIQLVINLGSSVGIKAHETALLMWVTVSRAPPPNHLLFASLGVLSLLRWRPTHPVVRASNRSTALLGNPWKRKRTPSLPWVNGMALKSCCFHGAETNISIQEYILAFCIFNGRKSAFQNHLLQFVPKVPEQVPFVWASALDVNLIVTSCLKDERKATGRFRLDISLQQHRPDHERVLLPTHYPPFRAGTLPRHPLHRGAVCLIACRCFWNFTECKGVFFFVSDCWHGRSQEGNAPSSKFLENLVILCFGRRCPKQNTVASLKSKILAPQKFCFVCATGCWTTGGDSMRGQIICANVTCNGESFQMPCSVQTFLPPIVFSSGRPVRPSIDKLEQKATDSGPGVVRQLLFRNKVVYQRRSHPCFRTPRHTLEFRTPAAAINDSSGAHSLPRTRPVQRALLQIKARRHWSDIFFCLWHFCILFC